MESATKLVLGIESGERFKKKKLEAILLRLH